MKNDLCLSHGYGQTQRSMNVEVIGKVVPAVVALRVEPSALPRSFDVAIVDIEAQTRLQMRVHLRSAALRHRVPDHLRAGVRRLERVRFPKPFLRQFEHVGDFVFGEVERVVVARDDQRVPAIVFERVRCRVGKCVLKTTECVFRSRTRRLRSDRMCPFLA